MGCRINRRRLWTGRLLMEAASDQANEVSAFLTLTYNEDEVPRTADGLLTLDRLDGARWRDAIRKRIGRVPAFFFVGEYGDLTQRPHYHAMVFHVDAAQLAECVDAWSRGFATVSPITPRRASYVAGYTVKKMTGRDDARLDGREAEFAQMSKRPAIGDRYIAHLEQWLQTREGAAFVTANADVPQSIRTGGRIWPLGDRHRRKLRLACGLPEKRTELKAIAPHRFPPPELVTTDERQERFKRETIQQARRELFARRAGRI